MAHSETKKYRHTMRRRTLHHYAETKATKAQKRKAAYDYVILYIMAHAYHTDLTPRGIQAALVLHGIHVHTTKVSQRLAYLQRHGVVEPTVKALGPRYCKDVDIAPLTRWRLI